MELRLGILNGNVSKHCNRNLLSYFPHTYILSIWFKIIKPIRLPETDVTKNYAEIRDLVKA